jgi:hypothetical protein
MIYPEEGKTMKKAFLFLVLFSLIAGLALAQQAKVKRLWGVKPEAPDDDKIFYAADTIPIIFDQPMDTLSVFRAFHLRLQGDTAEIPGYKTFNGSEDTFFFIPTDTMWGLPVPLIPNLVYKATMDTMAQDIAGTPMVKAIHLIVTKSFWQKGLTIIPWEK